MLSLRLLRLPRLLARRSPRARRPAVPPRRPRLSFECLESRDLLAATMGAVALPMPTLAEYAHNVGAVAPQPGPARSLEHVPVVSISATEEPDGALTVVVVDADEHVIVLVDVPAQYAVRPLDGSLRDGEHFHEPVAPALADEVAYVAHVSIGGGEAGGVPATAPVRAAPTPVLVPADSARVNAVVAPALVAVLLPPAANLPLPALDSPAPAAHAYCAEQAPVGRGEFFVVGVPGPTQVSIDEVPPPSITSSLSYAGPPGMPWLAGLLTPVAQFDVTEPLFALETAVSAAHSWGQTFARTLASVVLSPWLAGAAMAMAAVEVCRRRTRRAARPDDTALDVPEVGGPSPLI